MFWDLSWMAATAKGQSAAVTANDRILSAGSRSVRVNPRVSAANEL